MKEDSTGIREHKDTKVVFKIHSLDSCNEEAKTIPGTRTAPAETGSRAQGADGGLRDHGRGGEDD